MKTWMITLVMICLITGQSFASEGAKNRKDAKEMKDRAILSPELDTLFFSQRLGEAVIKPIYSSTEQLIFSEQIKLTKKEF